MQTHTSQDAASKTLSSKTTEGTTQGLALNDSASQTTDQRSEAGAMRQLQSQANHSPRALQLQSLQKMAGQSPQASRLNNLQAMADGRAAQRMQHQPPALQRQTAAAADNSPIASSVRPTKNNGLPAQLQAGVESLSGMSLDHVHVHYNSSKPAQLQAHAYAQGSDIHLAPGQEQHLPHEAWHVVQQAQGRVRPTLQMKQGVPVNDDVGLEQEADVMGARAMSVAAASVTAQRKSAETRGFYSPGQPGIVQTMAVAQLFIKDDIMADGYTDQEANTLKTIAGNSWGSALDLAKKIDIAFFRKINALPYAPQIKRRILDQLDNHYYEILKMFCTNQGGDLSQLVLKGVGRNLVESMIGYPTPPLKALVLAMSGVAAFNNIGKLGFICMHYPQFIPIISAQMAGAAAQLQTVITWLSEQNAAMLAVLEAAVPNFGALQGMVARLTNTGSLTATLANYPNFRAIAVAQVAGAPALLQTVMTWLSGKDAAVLALLEAANPNFVALQAMAVALTNISSLARVLGIYANLGAIVSVEMIAAPALLQTVISDLSIQDDDVLAWLETNNPNFAVLQVLAAQSPDKALLGMLVNFAKEVAPGNDDYEAIGTQSNEYRIGHFALGHTLRGMLAVPALNGTKTLWPAATTLAELRNVCLNFDDNNVTTPNTAQNFFYTPTVAPTTAIAARKNSANNRFDQVFPRNGTDISPGEATKLSAINAVKNNWTAIP